MKTPNTIEALTKIYSDERIEYANGIRKAEQELSSMRKNAKYRETIENQIAFAKEKENELKEKIHSLDAFDSDAFDELDNKIAELVEIRDKTFPYRIASEYKYFKINGYI